ncbi:hypothetical protein MHU86_11871 [Fragilaria crotonensis]|nr:hypothetical protein MHU86_11871 [Fragilaria crotonensis]
MTALMESITADGAGNLRRDIFARTIVTSLRRSRRGRFRGVDECSSTRDSQAIALDTFHQSTSESTRVSFDADGNRVTERIYRQQDRPDVIRTTIENAEDILNATLNLGPQSTYQHLRIPKRIEDHKTEHRNASMLDPVILPSDGSDGIDLKSDVLVEDPEAEAENFFVIDPLIQPPERANTIDLETDIPIELGDSSVRDPLIQPSNRSEKVDLVSDVEYLGVLLDAAHYFPVEWIYHLLDHLELLGFNLLHFRLTDDQAFNIRLDSHPNWLNPPMKWRGKCTLPPNFASWWSMRNQRAS